MIVVKLMAGLGNQMFQYATGRQLAHRLGTGLRLDLSLYKNMAEIDTPRHYDLDCYRISSQVASRVDLSRMLPTDFQATLAYRTKRRLGFDKHLRPLGEPNKAFYDVVLRARDNTYLVGWWQNEKYFADIRNILLIEFEPKKISTYSQSMLKLITGSNAVSIHVRRGDYVTNKYAKNEHGLVPLSYYSSAANHIIKRAASPHFFVFSDDMDWCKKNLKLGSNIDFVESKGRHDCEDIWLMQHCQHNIIANSSFSWWGGWLNENPGKLVIAPKSWFANKEADKETEIVPEAWMRL